MVSYGIIFVECQNVMFPECVCVCFLSNTNNLQASVIAALPSVSVCVIKISDVLPWYNEPRPEHQCKTGSVSGSKMRTNAETRNAENVKKKNKRVMRWEKCKRRRTKRSFLSFGLFTVERHNVPRAGSFPGQERRQTGSAGTRGSSHFCHSSTDRMHCAKSARWVIQVSRACH